MLGDPLNELVAALRRLHREAGEPSTHEIGKRIGYSHTTVAKALDGTRCPSWPVLQALVEHLRGDLDAFKSYWVAVRDAQAPLPEPPAPASGEQPAVRVRDGVAASDSDSDSSRIAGERVLLRWRYGLEVFEFLDEGLALKWLEARRDSNEQT
jgi:hypothetical protein